MGREYGSRTNNFSADSEIYAARRGGNMPGKRGTAMKCITILYPAKDNEGFGFDFYLRRHVPLIKDILGASLHRLEVRKGASAQDGGVPTYTCVISIWVADWPAYEKALAARASELIAEVPLFTKVMPVIQTDEVIYP
jgi:uncharacterized protein (TIGR02118 family)